MVTTADGIWSPDSSDLYRLTQQLAAMAASIQAALDEHNRLRLKVGNDLSLDSTLHAFQIGPDTGSNLAMDTNEIMSRIAGAPASLLLNRDGGDIYLGAPDSKVYVEGRLVGDHYPYAMSAGIATVSVASGETASITITFPAGRFTEVPRVTASAQSTAPSARGSVTVGGISTAGFTAFIYNSGTVTASVPINWQAIQMRAGSGSG